MKLMDLGYSLNINTDEVEYLFDHLEKTARQAAVDMQCFEKGCKYFNMVNIINNIHDWRSLFAKEKQKQTVLDVINSIDYIGGFD
jgi:hypothetical protein